MLYEGRQIYFGPCNEAKSYFVNMGFDCAPRQTTADFLTSLTSPVERLIRPGFEGKTPRNSEEFVHVWQSSPQYSRLNQEIERFNEKYQLGGSSVTEFTASRQALQSTQQ